MSMFFKAKCHMCWETIPCNCPEEKERSYGSRPDNSRLIADQNYELKRIADALEKQNKVAGRE